MCSPTPEADSSNIIRESKHEKKRARRLVADEKVRSRGCRTKIRGYMMSSNIQMGSENEEPLTSSHKSTFAGGLLPIESRALQVRCLGQRLASEPEKMLGHPGYAR